jgi:hypothetical protein
LNPLGKISCTSRKTGANSISKMQACNPHQKCCENLISHNAMSFMEIQLLKNWYFRAGKTDLKMVRDHYTIKGQRQANNIKE